MSMSTNSGSSSAIRSVALATEAICGLPAVASLDWTDKAAACFTSIAEPSRVCAMICSVDETGRITSLEATGVAASGRTPTVQGTEPSADLALRSRADRLGSVGFDLGISRLATGVFGTLDSLINSSDWRQTGLGQMWQGLPAGEVLVGALPLGNVEPGRIMLVQVATNTPIDPSVRNDRLAVMKTVFPILISRAITAVGEFKTTSARWLTHREQEVLEHLTLGKSVRQIADALGRSQHTVHDHVKSLHRKLNASSRGELVARALGHIMTDEAAEETAMPEIATTRAATLNPPVQVTEEAGVASE